jgi:two-component system, response regulator, stage 0 sporulation protein F
LKHLLIVEDDKNTLSGLIELFRGEGFQVTGTTCGSSGIDAVINNKIDAVLCDYKLPDIDGLVVSRKIKQMNPDIKIFLMTAFYRKTMDDVASFCGIEKIFQKPVQVNNLISSLISSCGLNKNDPKISNNSC